MHIRTISLFKKRMPNDYGRRYNTRYYRYDLLALVRLVPGTGLTTRSVPGIIHRSITNIYVRSLNHHIHVTSTWCFLQSSVMDVKDTTLLHLFVARD